MENQTTIINSIPQSVFDGITAMLKAYFPTTTNEAVKAALSNLAVNPAAAAPDNYITRNEAAAMLRTSIVTIDRYVKDGLLKSHKVGKKLVRIAESSVIALLSGK